MSFVFILTGCDLFPKDNYAYLDQTVAKVEYVDGTTDKISVKRFIQAYNSYGSSLVESEGLEFEDAAKQTIDVLVNRYVLLHEAKKNVKLEDVDNKLVLEETYDSLVSNLNSYVSEVREEWDMPESTNMSEQTEDEKIVYTAFETRAKVVEVNGQLKIKLLDTTDKKPEKNFADVDAVINEFNDFATKNDGTNRTNIYREAYRRLLTTLKANEEGQNLSTDNASVLKRYVLDVKNNVEENKYIEKLEEYYKADGTYSTISVEQVLAKYKALLFQSKFKFESSDSAYDEAMLNSYAATNYFVDDSYIQVSHILVKFDEEVKDENGLTQKQKYDNLKSKLEKGEISQLQYQTELNNLVSGIKANVRNTETGEVEQKRSVSAENVLSYLKQELAAAKTDAEKEAIFKNYIYTYNEDPGAMNADYLYVIGQETSNMVDSFNEDARKLDKNGEYGAISEKLVVSDYGVHILFYAGRCENLFTISDYKTFKFANEDVYKLEQTKLNPFHNKTVFDLVFEQLSSDSYSIFENMNLNILKANTTITIYHDVYKNL